MDKTAANQVVHVALHVGQRVSRNARGDNGVVVGHLRIVEHLFALAQRCAAQGREQVAVDWCYAVENTFTFRIDVVREIRGVYARIGGELALVEALDDLQRLLGRIAELLVAFHLQPREVEEARRCFRAVFLGHGSHGERRSLNFGQCGASFLLRLEASAQRTLFVARRGGFFFFVVEHSGKERVAVGRGEHPVILGFEILNLLLAVHDKRERGRLHAAYGKRLLPLPAVAAVFQCIEARGVHAQEPVADGAAEAGLVERLLFLLRQQMLKSLGDGLLRERRHPKPLHGTLCARLLHDPALYEFALLPGIAAVDDAVGAVDELLDNAELPLLRRTVNKAYAEAFGHHGQLPERPVLPCRRVVLGIFQLAEMPHSPGHLIAIAFIVTLLRLGGPEHLRNVLRLTLLFCDADNHILIWSMFRMMFDAAL